MLFNKTTLDNKVKYLDSILKNETLLGKVLGAFSGGSRYEYELIERPWDPGGGSTLLLLQVEAQRYFLKAKSCNVFVESKLESEGSFINIPSLRNEYLLLQQIKDISPNTPKFFKYVEEEGYSFLFIENLSPFKDVIDDFSAKELLEVYEQIEGTARKLYEKGIVHTDIHENNLMFRGNIPVLIDFEEARMLLQQVPFEESLDVTGENAWGNVGHMPEGYGLAGGYTCLNRLKKVFEKLILLKIDDLVKECNFDSSCPFLSALDHGKDKRIYQSINLPNYSIEGQRPLSDNRIEVTTKIADRLFQKSFIHLDIGSNLGRFNIEISRNQKVKRSIGVEAYDKYVDLAKVLAFLSNSSNVKFVKAECGKDSLFGLLGEEKIDLVTIYSVYHHIENKKAFIKDLAKLNPLYLVFEMPVQKECYGGKSWQEEISLISRKMKMPYCYLLTYSDDYKRPVVLVSKIDVSKKLSKINDISSSPPTNKITKYIERKQDTTAAKAKHCEYLGFLPPPYDGMQTPEKMKFLYDSIIEFARCSSGAALEIGVYKACSIIYMSKACLRKGINEIYGIDLFTGTPSWNQKFDTFEEASSRIQSYGLEGYVTLIRTNSLEYDWSKKIDVLHIDGDHEYTAVKQDVLKYVPFVNKGGIVIFDDYDAAHSGVKKEVDELILEEEFEVVNVNYRGRESGSICLRKTSESGANIYDSESSSTLKPEHESIPKVSVVLPTYNHLRFLPKAVESVLRQTFSDFELIIVNDGSTDGTREYLDSLQDPRITIIHQENKRLPEALNTGFCTARGELLTWVSADNYCAPMFLEKLVSVLDANPQAGLAYSSFAFIDDHDRIKRVWRCPDVDYARLLLRFPGMASFMYRRICQEKVGLYNPALEGAEDWDMWLRIAEQFPLLYVPDILYYYRQHDESLTYQKSNMIFKSSVQVFQNAVDRLQLEDLYPSLGQCKNPVTAQFHAFFDFGTAVLRSKFGSQSQAACRFLEKAFSLCPNSLEVASNLATAYTLSGQWGKALPLLKMMQKSENPKVQDIFCNIVKAYKTNKIKLLLSAPLFELDKSNSELFQTNQMRQGDIFQTPEVSSEASLPRSSDEGTEVAAPKRIGQQIESVGEVKQAKPKLSVILTTYNRLELLAEVISGFANQTVPKEVFEVIVVDDGSEPPVKEVVDSFADQINITYLYQENGGLAAARNNGIRAANGQIVLFSDDDDVPGPELIAEHLRSHEENPDERIAVLGHLDWHKDLQVSPLMRYVTGPGGEYFGYGKMEDGQFYDAWKWWGGLISAKLSLLESVDGPFDSRLRFGYEDTELVCRLLHRGIRVLYNAKARSFILKPLDFEGFCKRRYKQGRALYRMACIHPEVVIPRYKLQDAANLYRSRYAPFLEERTGKVIEFESLLNNQSQLQDLECNKLLESIYKVYRECFRGYWLKGYVEEMEAVQAGKVSLSEPVNTQSASYFAKDGKMEPAAVAGNNIESGCDQLNTPRVAESLRITFISNHTPNIDRGSSNLRIYHILEILAGNGERIDYLYFNQTEDDERYKRAFDDSVNFVYMPGKINSFTDYLYFDRSRKIDYVWITNLWTVDYGGFAVELSEWIKANKSGTKIIIDTMDFHYKKFMRKFNVSQDNEDLLKAKEFLEVEKKLYSLADEVLTVTEVEKRDILENIGTDCNVSVISNIHRILPQGPDLQQRKHICFIGAFHVNHNTDAVKWFLREVFPLIIEKAPEIEFHILGFNNEKFRAELEVNPNVKVIGYVEDAESAVANYRLFVCPMTYGAGMKGKLGTAASAGTPIVTTTIGAEGFVFVDGQNCFIVDNPQEFARRCLRLLSEASLWKEFSVKAKEMVAEGFSVEAVGEKINALLRPVATVENTDKVTVRSVKVPAPSDYIDLVRKSKPKVSIITSCYNAEKFLPECLDSIKAQTIKEWELLLLDDASTDGTRSIIEKYSRMDERIKPYYFQDNKGPYARRNFAIERAGSDFIVMHDADDIMCPAKLEILYSEITRDERLGIVGSFYRMFMEEFEGLEYTEKIGFSITHDEIMETSRSNYNFCCHASAIIRKDLFKTIGLYDENPYGSDSFWLAKVAEYAQCCNEVRFKNIPEFLMLRRMHPASQTGLLPSFDPRSKRKRYREYFEEKLEEIRQKLERLPHTDIKAELKSCTCSDFIEKHSHLFAQWESEPLDSEKHYGFINRAFKQFANSQYISCIITLDNISRMVEGIENTFRCYDFLRGLVYFAINMDRQSREYLDREFQNHNTEKAREFISEYLEGDSSKLTASDRQRIIRNLISSAEGDNGSEIVHSDVVKNISDFRKDESVNLSIVITVGNEQAGLFESLIGLNEQSEKRFEVILVGRSEMGFNPAQIADRVKYGLVLIELEQKVSAICAKNIAIDHSKGQYVAFLGENITVEREFVKNVISNFRDSNISGLRGRILTKGGDYSSEHYDLGAATIYASCDADEICAFRKDVLIRLGGFNENSFGREGLELSYRVYQTQDDGVGPILYCPDVIVCHADYKRNQRYRGSSYIENRLCFEQLKELDQSEESEESMKLAFLRFVESLYPSKRQYCENNARWLLNNSIFFEKKFPQVAIELAEKAMALEPDSIKSCYALGSSYLRVGKFDKAQALLERILQPLANKLVSGRLQLSESEFESYSLLSQCYLSTCTKLAQCYMKVGEYDKLKEIYADLLNNPYLEMPVQEKARIRSLLAKLHNFKQPVAAVRTRGISVSVKSNENNLLSRTQCDGSAVSLHNGTGGPLVSIITSCYNAEKFLPECLDSIRNQTMNEWELFLLDDASTDSTKSIIEKYARMDERIKPYYFEDNKGPYVRRNFAIERANSDFIVIQDADDIMCPAKLEILYNEITKDERLGVVGAFYRSFLDEFTGLQYTDEHELPLEHNDIIAKFSCWSHGMSHGSAIIRKKLFEAIGLYDENPYRSDSFWFAKVGEYAKHRTDVKFKNIPEYLTLIRIHASCQTQLLPVCDPRSRRMRYRQYCEEKLREMRQKLESLPSTDIGAELKNCKCSDFIEKYGHLFAQWESAPFDSDAFIGRVSWAVELFNCRQHIRCISTLSEMERMEPNIAKRYKNYDLLRAMAFFAIDRKEQSLRCLNREIQNHNNPAAEKFISDYFENQSKADVQSWCLANDKLYHLQMIDTEGENVAGQRDRTVPVRHIAARQDEQGRSPVNSSWGQAEPLVSIIMPAYNATDYITEAIESVLNQNYRNFELIVVDDGSTDNTKDIVLSFKDERIKYFYQENKGAYSARNLAVKKAKGDFIVPLDTDDMITPDFIVRHLKEFEGHPDADLVYCDDYLIESDCKPIRVIKRPEYTDRKSLIRDLFRCGFPVVPFRTCIRRSVFDRIGLFDDGFRNAMDYDMIRRFVLHGLKAHHLKSPSYIRRMTPHSLSRKVSDEKARAHFEVIKRFTDTFTYDELFPDVAWDKIAPEMRQLHAECLAAVTCLAIGQAYIKSNSPIYAKTAFELACSELNDCLKRAPDNPQVRQLLQKCEFARAKHAEAVQQAVC